MRLWTFARLHLVFVLPERCASLFAKPITTAAGIESHQPKEETAHAVSNRQDGTSVGHPSSLLASAWYTTSDLAARLRVDTSTLRRWRTARPPQGPPFVTISERVIMYSALDVDEWLCNRRTVPTKGINGR